MISAPSSRACKLPLGSSSPWDDRKPALSPLTSTKFLSMGYTTGCADSAFNSPKVKRMPSSMARSNINRVRLYCSFSFFTNSLRAITASCFFSLEGTLLRSFPSFVQVRVALPFSSKAIRKDTPSTVCSSKRSRLSSITLVSIRRVNRMVSVYPALIARLVSAISTAFPSLAER